MAPRKVAVSLQFWCILVQFDAQSHPESSEVPVWLPQGPCPPGAEQAALGLFTAPALNSAHYVSIFSKRGGRQRNHRALLDFYGFIYRS